MWPPFPTLIAPKDFITLMKSSYRKSRHRIFPYPKGFPSKRQITKLPCYQTLKTHTNKNCRIILPIVSSKSYTGCGNCEILYDVIAASAASIFTVVVYSECLRNKISTIQRLASRSKKKKKLVISCVSGRNYNHAI